MLLVTRMTNIHLFPDEGVDATSPPQAPEPLVVRGGKWHCNTSLHKAPSTESWCIVMWLFSDHDITCNYDLTVVESDQGVRLRMIWPWKHHDCAVSTPGTMLVGVAIMLVGVAIMLMGVAIILAGVWVAIQHTWNICVLCSSALQ